MTGDCPICGCESVRKFIVREEYCVRGCRHCGHRFLEWRPPEGHVARAFGDGYFSGGGGGYPDYLSEGSMLRSRGSWYARLLAGYIDPPGTVLDVGAAAGFISDGFRTQGWRPEILEPNPQMLLHARVKLGLTAHAGTLETFRSNKVYDVISMIQVVHHLTDIRRAMQIAAVHTRPGGIWLVETWDNSSVSARLFGPRWHVYNPPTVIQYFSRRSLEHLCAQFGFVRIGLGRTSKPISCGHAKSLLRHHLGNCCPERLLRLLPDRWSIPYPADDLFWMLFQKQTEPAADRAGQIALPSPVPDDAARGAA